MRTIVWAMLLGAVLGFSVAYAQSIQYRPAESYMPEVLTIKRDMPDKGRLCVEPPSGGLVTCKTIGEVRWWFVQSTKK